VSALDWSAPFDQLRVGQSFRTGARRITEFDVGAFAALTGDRHPQHTDPQWADSSLFGERIAHGILVVACAFGLLPLDHARIVALRAIKQVVFKRPLTLGQEIHVVGQISRLVEVDDQAGLVTFGCDVRDGHDGVVARAQIEVLWRGGRAEAPSAGSSMERIDLPAGVIPY
jgi:3-hydroxybutyryl-CoA dehydratase